MQKFIDQFTKDYHLYAPCCNLQREFKAAVSVLNFQMSHHFHHLEHQPISGKCCRIPPSLIYPLSCSYYLLKQDPSGYQVSLFLTLLGVAYVDGVGGGQYSNVVLMETQIVNWEFAS
jgi:hypothetical protein